QAEERADFEFIEHRVVQPLVLLNNASFGIEEKGRGKSRNPPVLYTDVIGSERHGIVDTVFGDDCLDGRGIVIVDDEAENLEAVLVFGLETDEIVNLRSAGSAPGGPEIQKDDLAFGVRECDGFAIKADDGLLVLLSSGMDRKKAKK